MHPPSAQHARLLRRTLLVFLFLLAILTLFVANAVLLDRASLALVRSAIPPDTLEGIAEPRFFTSPDSYAWLSHTRDMLMAGDWRIRHTRMDNAPHGRPMHWSHLLIWELVAHARLLQTLSPSSLPISRAIEMAGRSAMPVFTLLFLLPAYWILVRKTGFLPAAAFLATTVSVPFLTESQSVFAPDHHLLQQAFLASTLACLSFAGWGRVAVGGAGVLTRPFWIRPLAPPSPSAARRWFVLAGAFHACLLWVGGSVWLVVHVVLCLSALAALAPPAPGFRAEPRLWLFFLASALPLSVAFYLLEYAPRFPGMRLEVNHPLHWLFLAGSTLFLSRISSFRELGSIRFWRAVALPLLLVLPLPLALLFGPASWHALHDPLLRRLHAGFIDEFRPLLPRLAAEPAFLPATFRFFLLPLVLAPVLAFRRKASPATAALRPLSVASLLLAALFAGQLRWGLLFAATLPFLAVVFSTALAFSARPVIRRLAFVFLAALFCDAAVSTARQAAFLRGWSSPERCPAHWLREDTLKRAALRMALAFRGDDSAAIAGLPHDAPAIYYFSGIPSLASFYWENADGWHAESALFSDTSPDIAEARAVAEGRALSCLLVPDTPTDLPLLHAALVDHPALPREALYARMALSARDGASLPAWLAPDSALSAALSSTNYYHPAPETRIRDALPVRAFRPVPQSP